MKKLFLLIILLSAYGLSYSQGCMAIRGNSACGGTFGNSLNFNKGEFILQFGYRHFKSFRHFRGDVEESNRVEDGTEVINRSNFFDVSLSYGITDRWYANAILPVVMHNRSSMYEHGGNPPNGLGERHETTSSGLADIRLGIGYWLFDPEKHDFNYAIGLGVKLPTGQYDYTDLFYNQGSDRDQNIEAVVDHNPSSLATEERALPWTCKDIIHSPTTWALVPTCITCSIFRRQTECLPEMAVVNSRSQTSLLPDWAYPTAPWMA